MPIEPNSVALFIPPGLKKFKLDLFERIGRKITEAGGRIVRDHWQELSKLPSEVVPIVGCTPELRPLIDEWQKTGRQWIYWDRGYCRRVFATWLPRGDAAGYYRWHINGFQLQALRDVPSDRWQMMQTEVEPWKKDGRHIVIACLTPTYERFHRVEGWTDRTLRQLARTTNRQIVVRDKESKRSLQDDLRGAHALVTHASNTAVEAVILGCPVFVDPSSAAAIVGSIDLSRIDRPEYPDRSAWLRSLAYSQFNETELVDGTLWRLIA